MFILHSDQFKPKSYLNLIKRYIFSEGEQFPLKACCAFQISLAKSRLAVWGVAVGCAPGFGARGASGWLVGVLRLSWACWGADAPPSGAERAVCAE